MYSITIIALFLFAAAIATDDHPSCPTITETAGGSCAVIKDCVRPQCLRLETVTLPCGCDNLATTTVCESSCGGCGIAYETAKGDHCATTTTSPATSASTTSSPIKTTSTPPVTTTSSHGSSSSTTSSSDTVITSPISGSNTTISSTTTTPSTLPACPTACTCTGQTITWIGTIWSGYTVPSCTAQPMCTAMLPGGTQTLTTCPSGVTCTGQTTSWTGTGGPSSCAAEVTCNAVLPGPTVVTSTSVVQASGPSSGSTSTSATGATAGAPRAKHSDATQLLGGFFLAVLGLLGGIL